jgi:virginiamycin B lyase
MAADGSIQEFALPNLQDDGGEITTGSDGALWFSMGKVIGRLTTSGVFQSFPLNVTAQYAGADYLTSGPDGAIWFTDSGDVSVGRVSLTGAV